MHLKSNKIPKPMGAVAAIDMVRFQKPYENSGFTFKIHIKIVVHEVALLESRRGMCIRRDQNTS